jgi:hypothetical protein
LHLPRTDAGEGVIVVTELEASNCAPPHEKLKANGCF